MVVEKVYTRTALAGDVAMFLKGLYCWSYNRQEEVREDVGRLIVSFVDIMNEDYTLDWPLDVLNGDNTSTLFSKELIKLFWSSCGKGPMPTILDRDFYFTVSRYLVEYIKLIECVFPGDCGYLEMVLRRTHLS
jgi:hypothetical protein